MRSTVDLCALVADELVSDCRSLSFIDGTGCQAFIDIAETLTPGATLVLEGATGVPLRVMSLLRLDTHPRLEMRP
jgi:anti-anti-sigma regulatory factor